MKQRQLGSAFAAGVRLSVIAASGLVLANCSQTTKQSSKYSPRVVEPGQPVPKGGGTYRVGDPYVIGGRTYVPQENSRYRAEGSASWYGADFHGRLTANGEVYDMRSISAAHPTLPLPCYVRVTNLENRRSLVVRVNDRGPYHGNRVIDLSARAAKLLGFYDRGTANVRVEFVGRAALGGSDDEKLEASLQTNEPVAPVVRVASSDQRLNPPAPALAPTLAPAPIAVAAAPPIHSAALFGRGLY
jgi:rare lipoprotein A